jgi:hypothetical protein
MRSPLFFLILPFLAAALLAAAPATLWANCSNPTGLKGEIIYNDDYDTMQFCDDTNWVSMSASGTAVETDPQVDQLTASKWCKANVGGTAIDCTSTTVPAAASGSDGYVQFSASGTLGSDSALFWDATNHRLGIGTAAPGTAVDVSGTVSATLFSGSGASLTALNATNLSSGTIPDARFPATLPAASGVNLTALNASNLASGTIPDARFPATLPAASGVNLTNLNASSLASGTVAVARLGSSGTASSTTYLRGDNSWSALTAAGSTGHVQFNNAGVFAGSASLFWDNSNSRLGIGTAVPAYPLEVSGKAKSITMLLVPGSGGAPTGTGSATYWNQGGTDLYYMTGNVGIGTATPSTQLDIVGGLTTSGNGSIGGTLAALGNFTVATNKFFVNASTGNVGIGTTSPGQKLSVVGTIESTSGGFKFPDATTQTTAAIAVPSHAVMAFNLTTCPTGWSEYTLARGRFIRGIDNGAGNDPSGTRSPGNTQADDNKSHAHTGTTDGSPGFRIGNGGNQGGGGYGNDMVTSDQWANTHGYHTHTFTTAASGSESRPKNVALLYCEKD